MAGTEHFEIKHWLIDIDRLQVFDIKNIVSQILIATTQPKGQAIALDTRARRSVLNEQSFEITPNDRQQIGEYERKYPHVLGVRNDPTPIYNCHGLTFAARRTMIWDRETLNQILTDDRYTEVRRQDVKPGDVMMYMESDGGFSHSAVVVGEIDTFQGVGTDKQLVVISKWGKYKEVIHAANYCPYSPIGAKFYRMRG